MSAPLKFERMVLDVTRGPPEESTVRMAAEFARQLGLELEARIEMLRRHHSDASGPLNAEVLP